MTITCAWCTAYMGEKDGEGTTHSICASCKSKLLAESIRLANLRAIHAVEDAMALPKKEEANHGNRF